MRGEGSSRGHVPARARQRSSVPRPHAGLFARAGAPGGGTRGGTARPQEPGAGEPAAGKAESPTRAADASRSGFTCTRTTPAEAQFRSPPPLRSGGRGPWGGGSRGMHRQPVEPGSKFPPLPAQFAGGGAGGGPPRHAPATRRTRREVLPLSRSGRGERAAGGMRRSSRNAPPSANRDETEAHAPVTAAAPRLVRFRRWILRRARHGVRDGTVRLRLRMTDRAW